MKNNIIEQANALWANGQEDEAIEVILPLADSGNIAAKSCLGLMYCFYTRNDKFVNIQEGHELLNEACEAGDQSACHNLGTLWLGNIPSVGNDLKKAAYFYLKAKDLGGPVAEASFYKQWERIIGG